MSDPMTVVARLRRLDLDRAQRSLADCLRAETDAAAVLRHLDARIAAEMDAASGAADDDRPVDAFSVWMRRVGAERAMAADALAHAETHSAEARAVLAASRAAAQAVVDRLARREAERQATDARRAQAALDEAGTAPRMTEP